MNILDDIMFDDEDFDESSLLVKEESSYKDIGVVFEETSSYCERSMDPEIRAAIDALDKRKQQLNLRG